MSKKVPTSVRLDSELLMEIDAKAKAKNVSRNELIEELLREAVAKNQEFVSSVESKLKMIQEMQFVLHSMVSKNREYLEANSKTLESYKFAFDLVVRSVDGVKRELSDRLIAISNFLAQAFRKRE